MQSHCTAQQYLLQKHTPVTIRLGVVLSHPSQVLAEVERTLRADVSLPPALFLLSSEMTTGYDKQLHAYTLKTPYYTAQPLLYISIHNNEALLIQIQRYLVIAAEGHGLCNAANSYKQN
jgi:hypothetical protein